MKDAEGERKSGFAGLRGGERGGELVLNRSVRSDMARRAAGPPDYCKTPMVGKN